MECSLLVMLLKNLVILPYQEIKIELKDENSKKIIKVASKKYSDKLLIVSQKWEDSIAPSIEDLPKIGVISNIKSKIELPNGNLRVTLKGEARVNVLEYETFTKEIISANIVNIELPILEDANRLVLLKKIKKSLKEYIESSPTISNSIVKTVNDSVDLNLITDVITTFLPLDIPKKISYMQEINSGKRALNLIKDLNLEKNFLKLEAKIDEEISDKLSKDQEIFYLEEKLKIISKKVGKDDIQSKEINKYNELLEELNLPKSIKDKIKYEIKKLNKANVNTPEASIIRNYLDTFFMLPWNKTSVENLDSKDVLRKLNKSHFGLRDIKSRIIDYVNVKNINKDITNPVICLVGPPGVGKTTIASSIAASLNREFYKISVGGLNDSTELIGSRRTYLGALPGKIIQGLKKCQTNNPVFLIDEVDKMVKDYKGDPASTLLDILDVNQNKEFIDNYIEEPFNLSNVLFILTANSTNDIPYTLLDRLEIIEISSYTAFEKIDLAKKYILPRILENFKIQKNIIMKDETYLYIINNYTRESGVRDLTRIMQKLVTKVITLNKSYTVSTEDIFNYLGKPIYKLNTKKRLNVGEVNALAHTNYGGTLLRCEVSLIKGNRELITTGMLGNSLLESIKVSLSFIKNKEYIDNKIFNNNGLHIHLLNAYSKKDGPSCGVAITTAIISECLRKKVSEDIAFTGEISLKGDILKIGGLKEKLIAAYNSGIKIVYIPKDNEQDLEEIPKNIITNLKIVFVNNYNKIFEDLFLKNNI